MARNPNELLSRESDNTIHIQRLKNSTWFPILLGVLCGMITFLLLAMLETPSYYRLTVWIFNETSPKALFAKPAYFCVHRTLLLTLATVGGSIGALFSRWRKGRSILFLLAILSIIAVFAALGFH
jgi:hypothetical protein